MLFSCHLNLFILPFKLANSGINYYFFKNLTFWQFFFNLRKKISGSPLVKSSKNTYFYEVFLFSKFEVNINYMGS